ncbi:SPP1 gp17-like tail completion protein [Halorubrum tailed virus 25]|uniref:SPP1 gp17-like tail completion protein n=1 Tax=Halorubrum tailed virus 25 TaxID=2878006 RepID=A0AAE8Y127_9CAUD|nr:tail tube protein [Halorubrum tailed virus 25]UBF22603.1 SPP1 gp17-like tail completion protein [Halorubrum tailed virus 25]
MKEQDIIFNALSDLEAALPVNYTVRTRGGDAGAGPPLCILGWDSIRLSENGANPLAGVLRDESGTATGKEFHRYHQMELDVTIRTYDESDRDTLLSDVADAFLPYEYDADEFHEDTTEWKVGNPTPRTNPVVEPDWYEGGLTIRFKYVSRVQQNADALTSIDYTVDESGV